MTVTHVMSEAQYDHHPNGTVIARQGDVVLFKPLDSIRIHNVNPIKEFDHRGVILAHGEVTGHAHAVAPEDPTCSESPALYEIDDRTECEFSVRLLRLPVRSLLRHEEHSDISLPARDFLIAIQHEGDELGELRKVAD